MRPRYPTLVGCVHCPEVFEVKAGLVPVVEDADEMEVVLVQE
jgi:hypothetical protein